MPKAQVLVLAQGLAVGVSNYVLLLLLLLFGHGSLFACVETAKACSEDGGRFCPRRLEDDTAWARVG